MQEYFFNNNFVLVNKVTSEPIRFSLSGGIVIYGGFEDAKDDLTIDENIIKCDDLSVKLQIELKTQYNLEAGLPSPILVCIVENENHIGYGVRNFLTNEVIQGDFVDYQDCFNIVDKNDVYLLIPGDYIF